MTSLVSDTSDATRAVRADGLLAEFNAGRVLSVADVHVARRLGRIGGETDDEVLLAAALVVRATRHGSVVLDLATAAETTSPDVDDEQVATDEQDADPVLGWPAADSWIARCAASPLLGGPLRMQGSQLWLARYWDQESEVAAQLLARTADRPADLDLGVLGAGVGRVLGGGEESADQRIAVAVCALSRVGILVGGPGTGKTTSVARLLALLKEQHPDWRIALAAPTGRAAARLEESVRTARLDDADRARLGDLPAMTLHRLLGWQPGARSRFRHNHDNRLPYEVVVVDEASMVALTMMARLLEALRPTTRLVLVGDPDQLASVEAGAVLGDLVDRSTLGRRTKAATAELNAVVPSVSFAARRASPGARLNDGIAELTRQHRFDEAADIAALASAIRDGRAEEALQIARRSANQVELVEVADDDELRDPGAALSGVHADVAAAGLRRVTAAAAGDAVGALEALDRHRILCAHRVGPRGVRYWSSLAAGWTPLDPAQLRTEGHQPGDPLLVTGNDYDAGVYNGDSGVVLQRDDTLVAAFRRGARVQEIPLVRLGSVEVLHAMTVHRSQGSQFRRVTVVLPRLDSRLLTRQTLYTAVTRAQDFVRIIGSPEAFRRAVDTPAARASGLRARLA